eukprot:1909540-Pyramimonas_sp.AAC.1
MRPRRRARGRQASQQKPSASPKLASRSRPGRQGDGQGRSSAQLDARRRGPMTARNGDPSDPDRGGARRWRWSCSGHPHLLLQHHQPDGQSMEILGGQTKR